MYPFYFKKGKEKCWNVIEKFPKFLTFFKTLSTTHELHVDIFDQLEELVCILFGIKVSANNARWKGFAQNL